MASFIVLALLGYLAGSIPTAWIAGKIKGIDIRSAGSGNSGATNALRVLGPVPAALVLAADAGKGVFAVLALPALLGTGAPPDAAGVVAGGAAVLGHVFPVWIGFRGGKGVATGAAVAAALAPAAALVSLVAFIAVAAATRFVSLASLCAAAALPVAYALLYRGTAFSGTEFGFCAGAAALVVLMHRKNIRRLLVGTEPKLGKRIGTHGRGDGDEGKIDSKRSVD